MAFIVLMHCNKPNITHLLRQIFLQFIDDPKENGIFPQIGLRPADLNASISSVLPSLLTKVDLSSI